LQCITKGKQPSSLSNQAARSAASHEGWIARSQEELQNQIKQSQKLKCDQGWPHSESQRVMEQLSAVLSAILLPMFRPEEAQGSGPRFSDNKKPDTTFEN
jgi:hypothetical protein